MYARFPVFKVVRLAHLYFGVFLAPAILFFALTGALQTFSLHETTRGSDYKPAQWIVRMAQLHKKQMIALPVRRPPAAVSPGAGAQSTKPVQETGGRRPNLLPMKIFFAAVSLGLCVSTATGLWMSFRYGRNRTALSLTLLAGVAVPVLLLLVEG